MRRLGVLAVVLGIGAMAVVAVDGCSAGFRGTAIPGRSGALWGWSAVVVVAAAWALLDGLRGLHENGQERPRPTGADTPALPEATDADGLDAARVAAGRSRFGFNEVAGPRRGGWAKGGTALWGPAPWLLEAIVVASIALGRPTDAAVAAALVLVNALVRHVEESRADAVVAALERRLRIMARVRRDGRWGEVPARELVPGDLVRVRTGDVVPADLRLVRGSVAVDASPLTGESSEVETDVGGAVPAGAVVRRGEAEAVVTAIGARTRYGRTVELVKRARPRSAGAVVIAGVVRTLLVIVVVSVGVLVGLLAWRGKGFAEAVPLLLVLVSSALPVALPAMLTVSTALGAAELARSGVLVTRLDATEWAGAMDLLCFDKTGTITANRMRVVDVVPLGRASADDVLRTAALASCAADEDPLDAAILAEATGRGLLGDASSPRVERFIPFEATRRRTEAIVVDARGRARVAKGAVTPLEGLCAADADLKAAVHAIVEQAGRLGRRVIAVAAGPVDGAATLLGLLALDDPPRPEAAGLVARLRSLGVSVRMLSGDSLAVARAVGEAVGLPRVERADAATSPDWTTTSLENLDGLAEVYPEDKHRLVRIFQDGGRVVGMTGDGVNDAPALRQADVGIAVSGATDAARQAAGVVLCDPGLAGIVPLIEQGRAVQRRLRVWTINKVSRTVFKSSFVIAGYLFTGDFVVSALAMLVIVILSDVAKIAIATDRVPAPTGPESWHLGGHVAVATVLGLLMATEAIGALAAARGPLGLDADPRRLHAVSLYLFVSFGVCSVASSRERRRFWESRPSVWLGSALLAELLVGTAIALVGLPSLPPLGLTATALLLSWAAVACLAVNDGVKCLLLRHLSERRHGDERRG